jgi:hypothetical protein
MDMLLCERTSPFAPLAIPLVPQFYLIEGKQRCMFTLTADIRDSDVNRQNGSNALDDYLLINLIFYCLGHNSHKRRVADWNHMSTMASKDKLSQNILFVCSVVV